MMGFYKLHKVKYFSMLMIFAYYMLTLLACSKNEYCPESQQIFPLSNISLNQPSLTIGMPIDVNVQLLLLESTSKVTTPPGSFILDTYYREEPQDSFIIIPNAALIKEYPMLSSGQSFDTTLTYQFNTGGQYEWRISFD
jgi:hypothetical protein